MSYLQLDKDIDNEVILENNDDFINNDNDDFINNDNIDCIQELNDKVDCIQELNDKVDCIQELNDKVDCVQELNDKVDCVRRINNLRQVMSNKKIKMLEEENQKLITRISLMENIINNNIISYII